MKISLIGDTRVIMDNPDSAHNYFAWPSVVRLQNGKIAVAASGFRLWHICPFGKTVISYSEDNGETYTRPAVVIDTPLDDRDSGLLAFDKTGLIITSFNNMRHAQSERLGEDDPIIPAFLRADRSYRGGYLQMYGEAEEQRYFGSLYRISQDCGVTFGPLQKSPVTAPHGPIQLQDGRILWVGRPLYDSLDPRYTTDTDLKVYTLEVNGTEGHMEYLATIPPVYIDGEKQDFHEPNMVQLKSGRLVCHIRVEPKFTLFQSVSDDGGKTWSVPTRVLEDRGGAPAHLFQHSSGVLVSLYGRRFDPTMGIYAMFSFDEGETWDTHHVIVPDTNSGDLGYPASIELEDGSILTVFYAHQAPEDEAPAVIMQQKWRFEP